MQPSLALPNDISPFAPYRCPRCNRYDTIPMPAQNCLDRLIRLLGAAQFKCRACRVKFHRRPLAALADTPREVVESVLPRNVAVCHRDPASTLRRLDNIIRIAEVRRLRRG